MQGGGWGWLATETFFRKCGSKKLREQQPEDLCSAAETRGEPAEGARDSGLIRVGARVGGHTERAKTLTWMSQSLGAAAGIGRGNGQTRLLVRLSRENSNSLRVSRWSGCAQRAGETK